MRKRNLILIVLMVVVPVLLSGCFLWPKEAVLTLGFNPNQVPLNTPVHIIVTLRELNGVGVSLNYIKVEWFDQWGSIIGGWELEGAGAETWIQNELGATYIPGNGELSCSYSWIVSILQRFVYTYGGTDDNGNEARVSAEILIVP